MKDMKYYSIPQNADISAILGRLDTTTEHCSLYGSYTTVRVGSPRTENGCTVLRQRACYERKATKDYPKVGSYDECPVFIEVLRRTKRQSESDVLGNLHRTFS